MRPKCGASLSGFPGVRLLLVMSVLRTTFGCLMGCPRCFAHVAEPRACAALSELGTVFVATCNHPAATKEVVHATSREKISCCPGKPVSKDWILANGIGNMQVPFDIGSFRRVAKRCPCLDIVFPMARGLCRCSHDLPFSAYRPAFLSASLKLQSVVLDDVAESPIISPRTASHL